jgi:hypothetical protein
MTNLLKNELDRDLFILYEETVWFLGFKPGLVYYILNDIQDEYIYV